MVSRTLGLVEHAELLDAARVGGGALRRRELQRTGCQALQANGQGARVEVGPDGRGEPRRRVLGGIRQAGLRAALAAAMELGAQPARVNIKIASQAPAPRAPGPYPGTLSRPWCIHPNHSSGRWQGPCEV